MPWPRTPSSTPLSPRLQLGGLAVDHQQRRRRGRRWRRTGSRDHGVVDEVGAAHRGRARGRARSPLAGAMPRHHSSSLRRMSAGGLVVLGERPQRGPQLAHHGRGPGPPALDVADDDADPAGRQRDDVVPVAADLGLDALAVGLQRFGGHVAAGDLQPVQAAAARWAAGSSGTPARSCAPPRTASRCRWRSRPGWRWRRTGRGHRGRSAASVPVGQPGQGQAHHAQQLTAGVQRQRRPPTPG